MEEKVAKKKASNLYKKYDRYLVSKEEYTRRRREILQKPEEELSKISLDLNLFGLKNDIEVLIRRLIKRAWRLYKKIYSGSPTAKDIDMFIELADEIMTYEEFVSDDQMRVWQVSRDLIWAYKAAFEREE